MNQTTWRYLEMIWDDERHGGDTSQALTVVQELWPDSKKAVCDLFDACLEVESAEEETPLRDALVSASENYQVGGLPMRLDVMQDVLLSGLLAIGMPAVAVLKRQFEEAKNIERQADISGAFAAFKETAADCMPLLLAELNSAVDPKRRRSLRCAAANALGRIAVASPEVVRSLAAIAGEPGESQTLRSFCIEALMDLGPEAAMAIPTLERIRKEDPDDDLRRFAWSALKSVGASSKEHPCGGTMAEHVRSLYRAE